MTVPGPAQLAEPPSEKPPPHMTTDATTPRILLSVEAAAEQLSFSRTRMYALIKNGDIISVRVGRLRRIPAEALTEFTARLIAEQSANHGHTA